MRQSLRTLIVAGALGLGGLILGTAPARAQGVGVYVGPGVVTTYSSGYGYPRAGYPAVVRPYHYNHHRHHRPYPYVYPRVVARPVVPLPYVGVYPPVVRPW